MSDQVRNPEDRFSHNAAQIVNDNLGKGAGFFPLY